MKTLKEFRERHGISLQEKPVDGVAKGSLDGDSHMCASKIFHKEWQEGTPIIGEHAEPVNGEVAWYKVMFEHGIETVDVNDPNVEVLEEGPHGNHKKSMKKGY
tara:strand:+ start:6299 stop:6607 length:309 start_codon:yes stop_codon:yes gene_type:complete